MENDCPCDEKQKHSGERDKSKSQIRIDDWPPRLDIVIGSWWDAQDSFYEVAFDWGSTSTCSVKTTRPYGRRVHTRHLIHQRSNRAPEGTIVWGNSFALQTPLQSPDALCWKSLTGGKDFIWMRHKRGDADDEASQTVVAEQTFGDVRKEEIRPKSMEKTSGWIWRAVEKKETSDQEDGSKAAGKKAVAPRQQSKSTEETISAPRRIWKKAKGGQWRMIEK